MLKRPASSSAPSATNSRSILSLPRVRLVDGPLHLCTMPQHRTSKPPATHKPMMSESRQCETLPSKAVMFHDDPDALLDVLLDAMPCAAGAVADEGADDTSSGATDAVGSVVGLREVDIVDVVHGLAMQSRCSWGCPLHGAPPSPGACSMPRVLL